MRTLDTKLAWSEYFADIGLRDDVSRVRIEVAEKQLGSGVPVIFDTEHLSRLLGVTEPYLASASAVPKYHYRTFTIPKRRGGFREINSPRHALKSSQRWILDNILVNAKQHPSAVGFCRGKSIRDHAQIHSASDAILKLDIKDFFPSIELRRIIGVYQGFGYTPGVAFVLATLCCLDGVLPQGAATSPALSNIVCRRMDIRLSALAKKLKLKYSRYADDMAFSGRNVDTSILPLVRKIIAEEGFSLRLDKTRLFGKSSRRVLTGLSASQRGVHLLREEKRELRAIFHQIRKYGLLGYVANRKIRDPMFLQRLIGRFSFWCFIESDCAFAKEAFAYLTLEQKGLSERVNSL